MELPFAKKALGQHWLTDQASLRAICDAADVGADDVVLEIGPGLGTLTAELATRAKRVIAVEFDDALAAELSSRVQAENLEVFRSDIMSFDLTMLPPGYKVVANIPYYLTSNLIRVLSETNNPPSKAALLVQKEVAERVAAKPGDMSLLSVTAQWYWNVSLGIVVPARLFTPPPKVDSQILVLDRKKGLQTIDTKALFRTVKAGFSQRRKTLVNSLSGGLHLSRDDASRILRDARIAPNTRAQALSIEDWLELQKYLTR